MDKEQLSSLADAIIGKVNSNFDEFKAPDGWELMPYHNRTWHRPAFDKEIPIFAYVMAEDKYGQVAAGFYYRPDMAKVVYCPWDEGKHNGDMQFESSGIYFNQFAPIIQAFDFITDEAHKRGIYFSVDHMVIDLKNIPI